ncbi:HpsJ family protein [Cyanobium sp. T1B-Tous]|uniref:HpsJ family protein n=1 Tax=Cyanobium sp. T1B-Tous TaxID=2823721 RepID=UPI0020CC3A5B|nr:HpsJ family protein [Cyanobium sp. T1B-Tous]MCP9806293.1 HpsJ family protein [Cyanobium sp. T1B-Tous]
MSTASFGRLGHLLRWLGLTLVVLLGLQLLVLLGSWNWSEEGYRQLLMDRLVTQSPMALVGLLLMLFGSRLDHPAAGRTPLRWLVAVLGILLALAMLVAVPVSISGDRALSDQADQQLAARKGQLAMARAQMQNPQVIDQLIAQGEQAGQIPADASPEQKQQAAKAFMERQLQQADSQLQQQQRARDLTVNQRRFGGTGTAVVLAIGFVLVALVALL